jgi:hypothetical protein
MLSSQVIWRWGRTVLFVPVLSGFTCVIAPCACEMPPPTVSGHWAGRTGTGDSLSLRLDHDPGALTFTGAGRVGMSPLYQRVIVTGSVRSGDRSIDRFTLLGWQPSPVEFVADRPSPTRAPVDGELRFASGESTRLRLERVPDSGGRPGLSQ